MTKKPFPNKLPPTMAIRWLPAFIAVALLLLAACGPSSQATPTLSAQAEQGKQVFNAHCTSCHSTIPDSIIVGPSLAGIADRAGSRITNMDAEEYLRMSIEQPGEYLVEGYKDLMPPTLSRELSAEEKEAIITYLMSLDG